MGNDILRTYVAPLLTSSCQPLLSRGEEPVCWLDMLLHGGLRKPKQLNGPLVILLSGPPGAGKSLLAQQICSNRAREVISPLLTVGAAPIPAPRARSLIITTEATPSAIFGNLESLGLPNLRSEEPAPWYVYAALSSSGGVTPFNPKMTDGTPLMLVTDARDYLPQAGEEPSASFTAGIEEAWKRASQQWAGMEPAFAPAMVVVDSLNVLERNRERAKLFDELLKMFRKNPNSGAESEPEYLFLVLDTPSAESGDTTGIHAYWEYVVDVSIRIDYDSRKSDYFLRHLEIVKTRFQEHTLGKQIAKIQVPKPLWRAHSPKSRRKLADHESLELLKDKLRRIEIDPDDEEQCRIERNLATDSEGANPNVLRGGLFVFPSLHYVLSQIRTGRKLVRTREAESHVKQADKPDYTAEPVPCAAWGPGELADEKSLNWPVPWAFELVGGGMPKHRCAALVGQRGARQGHFAYQFLLDGVANGEETLVISFRDNRQAISRRLDTIWKAEQYRDYESREFNPAIIFQRPGNVTPEELLHRVITAVAEHSPSRVVINAVDHWHAAHPFLDESPLLVATLIDFLNAHEVTSMIVDVSGKFTAGANHGLTAKAQVVLSLEHRRIPWEAPTDEDRPRAAPRTRKSRGRDVDVYPAGVPLVTIAGGEPQDEGMLCMSQPKVIIRADRVPEAAVGSGRAVLEYTSTDEREAAGLKMIPLAPEFPEGESI